jgi:hypothetical protein
MATKRVTSPIRRILRGLRAAIFVLGGIGGDASVLVARQLAQRAPDHDIYDPAPREPSRRRRGRRRGRRED